MNTLAELDRMPRCPLCWVPVAIGTCCPGCGTHFGDPCPACGRRGPHASYCPELAAFVPDTPPQRS